MRAVLRKTRYRLLNPTRYVVEGALSKAFGAPCRARFLFASDLLVYTSETQFDPFRRYRSALKSAGVTSVHTDLDTARTLLRVAGRQFDVVALKLSFRTPLARVAETVKAFKDAAGQGAKFVYFDGDDDIGLQWPEILPQVDLYVKKHAFRDRSKYGVATVGKSNLTHYVHETHGFSFANDIIPVAKPVPVAEQHKIHVGYNVGLDDKIVDLRSSIQPPSQTDRPNDVVCRATVNPESWLYHLRKNITPATERLAPTFRVLNPTQRVAQAVYYEEMLSSKVCISPFGYGEICWRDFEAVLCGCLLVKPDMTHVETAPDVFVPYETYVPVKWDYSDLAEQCERFLLDVKERTRIVDNARRALFRYYDDGGFVRSIDGILNRLGLSDFDVRARRAL